MSTRKIVAVVEIGYPMAAMAQADALLARSRPLNSMQTIADALRWALSRIPDRGDYWERADAILAEHERGEAS